MGTLIQEASQILFNACHLMGICYIHSKIFCGSEGENHLGFIVLICSMLIYRFTRSRPGGVRRSLSNLQKYNHCQVSCPILLFQFKYWKPQHAIILYLTDLHNRGEILSIIFFAFLLCGKFHGKKNMYVKGDHLPLTTYGVKKHINSV